MQKFFNSILSALENGQDLVLCSIIASSGSTPRGIGAKMALFQDGTTKGTIGGGSVEYESIKLAKKALSEKSDFTYGFTLTHNQTADIGMVCGGQVVVYFQYFAAHDEKAKEMFCSITELYTKHTDSWLVTKILDGGVRSMGVFIKGEGLQFASDIDAKDIEPLCKAQAVMQKGEPGYYVEPLTRSEIVYVFGGGHVSQELVKLISNLSFTPVLYEDREAFATEELFPTASKRIVWDFKDIKSKISITENDYVVIMTRGHQADFELLYQTLQTKAYYVGVIGSRHKIAYTNQRLSEMGIKPEDIARIHTPIGLPIKADTPAEIAVSIAAELIKIRAESRE